MFVKKLYSCISILSLLLLSGYATAGVMQVSNLTNSSTFSPSISSASGVPNIFIAGKFTTDSQNYILSGAQAMLKNCCSTSFGIATYEAALFSDNGTLPGSKLLSFDNNPTLVNTPSFKTVDFFSTSGFELQASTSYWLGIRNTTGGIITWKGTAEDQEQSPGDWTIDDNALVRSSNAGSTWGIYNTGSSTTYVPQFSINTTTASVNEPSALLLLGLGFLGLRLRKSS